MFWHFQFTLTMCGFCQYYIYFKFKIVLYFFGLKHMWGQIFKWIKYIFYISYLSIHFTHFSMYVWRMLTLVRESCDPCWYSESSSFFHSWAWRDDESSLSSGIAIWSFPWSFLSTLNAGMSNTIMIFCAITTKGFTSQSSLLFPATLTVCFVKSHFRV